MGGSTSYNSMDDGPYMYRPVGLEYYRHSHVKLCDIYNPNPDASAEQAPSVVIGVDRFLMARLATDLRQTSTVPRTHINEIRQPAIEDNSCK